MNTQKIKLNLVPGGIPPIVHVSQYDVGRPLAFEIYDGMSAATIEAGTVIDIRATKPDGTGFEYACTWANNVVSIATQAQMTVLSGQIECELHLVKESQEIGTANFILEVEPAALRGDTIISETELPDIIDMARSHEQAAEAAAEAAADSAEAAADSASAAADSADDAAESARQAKSWAVPSTDPNEYGSDTNNAKYWSDQAHADYEQMESDLNLVNEVIALMRLLFGDLQITTESGESLITEDEDVLIMNY